MVTEKLSSLTVALIKHVKGPHGLSFMHDMLPRGKPLVPVPPGLGHYEPPTSQPRHPVTDIEWS